LKRQVAALLHWQAGGVLDTAEQVLEKKRVVVARTI